ncbi:unnamed protein product [Larinioides sclopetarius]|uniref:Uncharacterized protein n=1 Tax=Larinioides sclopetarius TaxID=280406 RepID=A0AAV2BKN7_9ARAC
MDEKLKLKVRSRRFGYLLKLAQELFSREPMKLGLQAFHDITSAVEDFSLEELKDFAEEIQVIYNKYLTYVVNGCQLHTALELFECSESMMKELFIVHPQVLRGLLVTFAQNDKMDEAYKFFLQGCSRKIYSIAQTETEESIWCLTVMSSWTIFEVEFIIKSFIKNVCLAWDGKTNYEIDQQPLVKIVFKESEEDSLEIDCLKKSRGIDSAKEIVCSVLQSLDSSIKWIEKQNPVCLKLVFETIYNHWINKSPNFLRKKNSRKNLLEDVRPIADKIQLSEERFGFKYSTESNSVKSLGKVLDELTPEYSVADTSHQLNSDKIGDSLLTSKLPENCQLTAPKRAFLDNNNQQSADFSVSRNIEPEQIVSDLSVSRNIALEQIISDLSVSRSIEPEQSISDLSASRRNEKEQIGSNLSVSRSIEPEQSISDLSASRRNETEQIDSNLSVSRSIEPEQSISDLSVSRRNETEQIHSNLSVSRSIEPEQSISDLSVSRRNEKVQVISDLSASRSIKQVVSVFSISGSSEQEQIISSSNQLSPYAHLSTTTCPTPDGKVSDTDASENIPTDFCSESVNQPISKINVRKICKKMKVLKSLGQLKSKKSVSKAVKLRKKYHGARKKNKPVLKKDVTLLPGSEESFTTTKNMKPGSSKQACSSKPCRIENFQITLRKSAQAGVDKRVVNQASEVRLAEPKSSKSVLNVPEIVFQKIVLFLRSKVLLKCKDLQPHQQQEKANHLATLFIQSNVVDVLDKKTMKLLSEFAIGCI